MDTNRAYISMGSNMDSHANFSMAIKLLREYCEVLAISSYRTTKPIGITEQPDFLNGVVYISTSFDMDAVARHLKSIEDTMGRDRTLPKFGPRNIDLDVVIWNDEVVDDDYHTRVFIRDAVEEINGVRG